MGRKAELVEHVGVDALRAGFRAAKSHTERSRYQALWLLACGESTQTVARVVGRCVAWVQRLRRRYNSEGTAALHDGRAENAGAPPLLSPEQVEELRAALQAPAPQGGLWSGPQVARWMGDLLGREVAPQRGWDYLRRLGWSPQRPRPRHRGADPEAQRRFQGSTSG